MNHCINQFSELIRSVVTVIWFFLKKRSKVIYFDIPASELFFYIDIDIIKAVSDYIELAKNSNLSFIDQQLTKKNFWTNEDWPESYDHLRYILKLGWLIKHIKEHGVNNPIQLLQSGNNKYIAHPGTARLLIMSYILPSNSIKIFYVWDPKLDPTPLFSNLSYTEITNPFTFLKLFKKSKNFSVKTLTLNNNLVCEEGNNYYFKMANDALSKLDKEYSLDFITCIDTDHWFSNIKNKIFFKDIISFNNDYCMFGGVRFNKINNRWIVDDKH